MGIPLADTGDVLFWLGNIMPGHVGTLPCMTIPCATMHLVPAVTVLLKLARMLTCSAGSDGEAGGGGRMTGGALPRLLPSTSTSTPPADTLSLSVRLPRSFNGPVSFKSPITFP